MALERELDLDELPAPPPQIQPTQQPQQPEPLNRNKALICRLKSEMAERRKAMAA